ncbi:MAG TPA: exodeoxyribonuclease VII small subunit [Lachnospiraceae bacterium]|nr:exodeoxyribonuclease VII small subunit [Lachnospiraceae bacterium]
MGKSKEELAELSLEEAFSQVEEAIKKLEAEDISLDTSFLVYREGVELLKLCNDKIERVEKQIVMMNEKGETDEF